jgi:hypothetical protein
MKNKYLPRSVQQKNSDGASSPHVMTSILIIDKQAPACSPIATIKYKTAPQAEALLLGARSGEPMFSGRLEA